MMKRGNSRPPAIDRTEAQRFLRHFPRPCFSFQTFDESPRKNKALTRLLHGSFEQHADELEALNKQGAGVYSTVNETNGTGRTEDDIVAVSALFVDLDGAPLEPVLAHPVPPHIVVATSPGRWHAYWLTNDCPLDRFKDAQKRLIQTFGSDPAVCDLPRVMRLPGFLNQKASPFLCHIIHESQS